MKAGIHRAVQTKELASFVSFVSPSSFPHCPLTRAACCLLEKSKNKVEASWNEAPRTLFVGGLVAATSQVKLLLPKFHRADSALRSQAAGGVCSVGVASGKNIWKHKRYLFGFVWLWISKSI